MGRNLRKYYGIIYASSVYHEPKEIFRHATFGTLEFQDGPPDLGAHGSPTFPNEKKKQYESRRDLKGRSTPQSESVKCNHSWVPHTEQNVVCCFMFA